MSPRAMSASPSSSQEERVLGIATRSTPQEGKASMGAAPSQPQAVEVEDMTGRSVQTRARGASEGCMHECRVQGAAPEGANNGDVQATSSFGSLTQATPTTVRSAAWHTSLQGACCCDCVPISGLRNRTRQRLAGAPETFDDVSPPSSAFTGKSGFRPRHRRGHSTGSIAHGTKLRSRTANLAQPRGWEGDDGGNHSSSTVTSTTSSSASAALAAAASVGMDENGRIMSGGRTSGSWGGVNSLDREFNRVLKAGVDVYKHCSTKGSGQQWTDVVPRRLKELLSRTCPLDDESQGLVTLFLDKQGEHFCWCPPGAAELVPDERYRLEARRLVEVVPGDEHHPRFLSLRAAGRSNPLVIELDSDELYDIFAKGLVRMLERNHIRDTLMNETPPV